MEGVCQKIPEDIVEVKRLREVINRKFHIGKKNIRMVLCEMDSLGLIEYKNNNGTIEIKWRPEENR